ncbi:ficolin-1-A-like [Drosophila sulfurigaster albostrigata]|uniref:ficolin-1-A-like n=1 Tax=Drosophila sulfurigaster albostrigata TaxID=89887 RepID=UPI002D21D0AE|nr:ficolin-1-A-like [Drosophila sulfurigaster albostrigata]
MTVSCESNLPEAGAGWTIIQRRKDGSVNFNRTWSEYREGFGNLHGEFFLGLEKIHLLTQSQPHEVFIFLGDLFNETRYARYKNFAIGNELEFYELKVLGKYSGNVSDSLKLHINRKFSTPDRYNHTSSNCPQTYNSGWWFTNCYFYNLNGMYVYSNNDNDVNGIELRSWKHRPVKFAHMMSEIINLSNLIFC